MSLVLEAEFSDFPLDRPTAKSKTKHILLGLNLRLGVRVSSVVKSRFRKTLNCDRHRKQSAALGLIALPLMSRDRGQSTQLMITW